jgi:hypothetical protein
MLYLEPETKEERKDKLQKMLNYAMKENWEGVINSILELASRENIELKT